MGQLVVRGLVLTVDDDRRVLADGAVYVNDGRIEAVSDASAAPPAGYKGAPRVRVDGVVAPGLIDLHNHLAYNTLPLWVARAGTVRDALPVATRRDRTDPTSRTPPKRSGSQRPQPRCGSRR